MRDILTLDRIQIEYADMRGPFIVVGAPQANALQDLLSREGFNFQILNHDFTDDVMFDLAPDTEAERLQRLLDAED
ncbi:MAG: hypothetical protein CVV27_17190 [Candidatus Melainabacteria bacterium HGW-Melainabacteria-1]|nr:MAG: hypothetical protein CVV27_17190 [Candidatus Melainabacteria bacterium HGW-Melainabacteria-1]